MAEILNLQHESDLSEYTSTVTDGGDLAQAGAAAMGATSGGLACVIDDTTSIYGAKTFTTLSSGAYGVRVYVDPNSTSFGSNDGLDIVTLYTGSSDSTLKIRLHWDGSNYEIRAGVEIDDTTWTYTSYYDVADAPHYVEVQVTYAAGGATEDGVLVLKVDGITQETISDLDLYTKGQPNEIRVGAQGIDSGISGTVYVDEVILRDDNTAIGPAVTPSRTGSITTIQDSDTSSSQSVTVPADAELAIVGYTTWLGLGAWGLSSLTLGGSAMTLIQEYQDSGNGGNTGLWYLASPSTGSQTLAWTWDQSCGEGANIFVVFYKDVDTDSPITGSGQGDKAGGGTGTATTGSFSSTIEDLCLCVGYSYTPTDCDAGAGANQSEIADSDFYRDCEGALGEKVGVSGSTTMAVSGNYPTVCACSIAGAAGAAPPATPIAAIAGAHYRRRRV